MQAFVLRFSFLHKMNELFPQYAASVAALPEHAPLTREDLLTETFLLERQNDLALYWAPFEHVERAAKVALVGITPGWYQTELAFRTARDALHSGLADAEASALARRTASFSGPIRRTLVTMLDGLGLHEALHVATCAELWGQHHTLLHTTALVRYPLFVAGKNYTGYKPDPLKTPLLHPLITKVLARELQSIPTAVIIPLGRIVSQSLQFLAAERIIDPERLLPGLPHPSGANAHRHSQYAAVRQIATQAVANWFANQPITTSLL